MTKVNLLLSGRTGADLGSAVISLTQAEPPTAYLAPTSPQPQFVAHTEPSDFKQKLAQVPFSLPITLRTKSKCRPRYQKHAASMTTA